MLVKIELTQKDRERILEMIEYHREKARRDFRMWELYGDIRDKMSFEQESKLLNHLELRCSGFDVVEDKPHLFIL